LQLRNTYFEEFGPKRVYIVGTDDIKKEFERAGLVVVEDDPEIVVVTFDKTLTYEKLKRPHYTSPKVQSSL